MDDILWRISWSAALTPDLQMIPDRTVFLQTTHVPAHDHASLLEDSLLPLTHDSIGADVLQSNRRQLKDKKTNEQEMVNSR